MLLIAFFTAALSIPVPSWPVSAQDEPDFARRVLDRHTRVGDMVLEANYRRSLQIAQETWAVEGTVRRLDDEIERFRIDGKIQFIDAAGAKEETQASLWRRGEIWYFVDKTAGTWCQGKGPGLGGEASAALYGLYDLPFSADPERNRFDAAAWSEGGRARFAGEICNVIEARTEAGAQQRWLLSKQDHLPASIRSEQALAGADALFETWSRKSYRERRVPEARIDPIDFTARGWNEVQPIAVSVAEAFVTPLAEERSSVISLADGLEPFYRRFNRGTDHPRLVGLFGPT